MQSEQPKPSPARRTPGEAARATARKATKVFKEMEYPHGIHPALVPGVSIEDQRIRYGIDKPLVATIGAVIIAFVTWGVIVPDQALSVSSAALGWIMENVGWFLTLLAIGIAFFLLAVAASRYGRIPLGLDGEPAEYSTTSWAAMLFGAGIGIGIIFFGTLEPLTYYVSGLPGLYEAASPEAVKGAIAQATFHWGIQAWAIYAAVGLGVAYVSFRKGRVPLMSSVLAPLWGGDSSSPGARIIDGLAIFATLFGTASSLGLGAMQISRGVEVITGWSTTGNTLALTIITVLTCGTIISAVSGVAKGIRRLSNINLVLSIFLALFFFVLGPTVFLLNIIPGVLVTYFKNMPGMFSATMVDNPETAAFLSGWTIFYWAWWVSWAPFVGVFVAKISRGRSIRQFVVGVLFIPSSIMMLAFTMLGGTALFYQSTEGSIVADNDPANLPAAENSFFLVLEQVPGHQILLPLVLVMLVIFFITAADSAALVNSQMSQQGNPKPRRLVTAFWAICMAGIAVVMLLTGGPSGLQGLQNFVTVSALPFAFIIVGMCFAILRELRRDPLMIRERFGEVAVEQAVRRGIEEHGDDFELSVDATKPDEGVGAEFDSSAEEYTEWYQRTDEDGNPVDYDYATGSYADEAPADAAEPDAR